MGGNSTFDFMYACSVQALYDGYSGLGLEHNPDISGTGVLIGFLGTPVFALLFMLLKYLLAYDPTRSPFSKHQCQPDSDLERRRLDIHVTSWTPNPIDVHFLAFFRRYARIDDSWQRVGEILDDTIINLCDTQIITGFAVLVSGFISLADNVNPLVASDWIVVVYLAWCSAATHLAGLTTLRTYLERRKGAKALRIEAMFGLVVFVIISMVPTGYFNWGNNNYAEPTAALPKSPALCYFNVGDARQLWGEVAADFSFTGVTNAMQTMIVGVLLLVYTFAVRCIKLSSRTSRILNNRLRRPIKQVAFLMLDFIIHKDNKHPFTTELWTDIVVLPIVGLYLCLRWVLDLYTSLLAEIIWLAFVLAWGVIRLRTVRDNTLGELSTNPDRDDWSFGQIIAVALLAVPLFNLLAHLIEARGTEHSWRPNTSPANITQDGFRPSSRPLRIDGASDCNEGTDLDSLMQILGTIIPLQTLGLSTRAKPGLDPKRRCAKSLLAPRSCTVRPWLALCALTACSYWIGLGISAALQTTVFAKIIFEINGRARPNSVPSMGMGVFSMGVSIFDFWFASFGLFWWTIITYPVMIALSVATGIHIEHCYPDHRSPRGIPTLILVLFGMILLVMLVLFFCFTSFFQAFHIPLSSPILALACTFLMFLLYFVFLTLFRCFAHHGSTDSGSSASGSSASASQTASTS